MTGSGTPDRHRNQSWKNSEALPARRFGSSAPELAGRHRDRLAFGNRTAGSSALGFAGLNSLAQPKAASSDRTAQRLGVGFGRAAWKPDSSAGSAPENRSSGSSVELGLAPAAEQSVPVMFYCF